MPVTCVHRKPQKYDIKVSRKWSWMDERKAGYMQSTGTRSDVEMAYTKGAGEKCKRRVYEEILLVNKFSVYMK